VLYFRKKVEFDEFVSFSDGLFGPDVVFEVAFSLGKEDVSEIFSGGGEFESVFFLASWP
jgi:hypothetical protein